MAYGPRHALLEEASGPHPYLFPAPALLGGQPATVRIPAAARAALEFPAHLVALDLLRVHGRDLTGLAFSERHAALEALFLQEGLAAPWSLCPTTSKHMSWAVAQLMNENRHLLEAPRSSAAGDGLGLVGAGEGCYRKHRSQCHEHAENGFTHRNSSSRPNGTSGETARPPPHCRSDRQRTCRPLVES